MPTVESSSDITAAAETPREERSKFCAVFETLAGEHDSSLVAPADGKLSCRTSR